MSVTALPATEKFQRVKNILIAQDTPANAAPYEALESKYGVTIHFVKFHSLEGYTEREYRKQRVYPNDFSAIVFTGRTAIDHFFRLCEDLRIKMSDETKYFCASENTANYLQKFINFRKRRVFNGTRKVEDLKSSIVRHKKEKYFLPCSEGGNPGLKSFFDELGIPVQEAEMYRTVYTDLSDLKDIKYDVLAFFTALEVNALFENFPDFKQEDRRICVFGNLATKAITERGMEVHIQAGTPEVPSIAVALDNYLKVSNP